MNEISIYGEIGSVGITDTDLISELSQSKGQNVKFRLNSPGGDVFQGYAMYNAIKEHGQCDMYIDGLAASMASIIMLAGRRIYASKNAMIMIHNPSIGDFQGDSKKLKSLTQLLDKIKKLAIDSYSERTMIDIVELSTMLDNETWLTAQEALDMGFIDEITDEVLEVAPNADMKSKTPKKVFMSYKKKAILQTMALTDILGIANNSDTEAIMSVISTLKNKSISLEAENNRIKRGVREEQNNEAKNLVKFAIEKGVINKNLERGQLMAFNTDFKNAKADLLKAINEVEASSVQVRTQNLIKEIVLGSKGVKTTAANLEKPKSEWSLHDYRKHAPQDLENNKELYADLLKKEYNR